MTFVAGSSVRVKPPCRLGNLGADETLAISRRDVAHAVVAESSCMKDSDDIRLQRKFGKPLIEFVVCGERDNRSLFGSRTMRCIRPTKATNSKPPAES